jgi:hypothetical protein
MYNSHTERVAAVRFDDLVDLPRFQAVPERIFGGSEIHSLGRSSCNHRGFDWNLDCDGGSLSIRPGARFLWYAERALFGARN